MHDIGKLAAPIIILQISRIMKQSKQIICSRIRDIQFLQQNIIAEEGDGEGRERRYDLLIDQKKKEKYRNMREVDLLNGINGLSFSHHKIAEEFYSESVEICVLYDPSFEKYQQKSFISMQENIQRLYCNFFNLHGFHQKAKLIQGLGEKGFSLSSPSMLLGWMSEWSKKIYNEILQTEIRLCFKERKEIGSNRVSCSPKKKQISDINKTQLMESTHADESDVFLSNRATVYGYFLEELQGAVRIGYVLSERNSQARAANIKKAGEILTDSTANKEIKTIMEEYRKGYREKYPREQPSAKSSSATFSPVKKKNLEPIRKITMTASIEDRMKNESKLLSSNISELQMIRPRNIETKMKRLESLNQQGSSKSTNIEFPSFKGKSTRKSNDKMFFIPKQAIRLREIQKTDLKERFMKNKDFFKCESYHQKLKPLPELGAQKSISVLVSNSPSSSQLKHTKPSQDQYDDLAIKSSKKYTLSGKSDIQLDFLIRHELRRNLSNQ